MIKKSIYKILLFLIIIGLNWTGLSAVWQTSTYLNDTENSSGNSYSAGILDFSLNAGDWAPEEKVANLQPGESVSRSISVINNGTLVFQYNAKTEIDTENSDTAFCDALNLKADLEGNEYNGNLNGLNFSTPIVISGGQDNWTFTITLSSSYTPPEESAGCSFKFIFDGWQENLAFGQGFFDTEELENAIETGGSTTSGYSPIADARIEENKADKNYDTGDLIIKSKNPDNKRTFIKFDFNFPSDTTILSSNLKLYMKSAPSVSRTYEAWRVVGDWTEKGIKWNNQPGVAGSVTDSISSGVTKNIWLSWDVISDVQGFVSGTSNYGWQLKDSTENSSTAYEAKFHSRESNSITLRPVLEVTFSSPEITTDHLVINEVYYHVGSGKGSNPQNEWVEIYNPTDSAVDISEWKICDGQACDTIPTSNPIPAKGFAVITYKSSTWDKWTISAEAIKIVLDSAIGNGLANAGDRIILKDASNTVIDAMSYGNDTTYFELSVSGKGKSLARIIKGYDTNSATDWIINATPNPGTNPSVDGVETLIFTSYGVAVAGWESVIEEDDSGEEEIFEDEPVVKEESTEEEVTTEENQDEGNQEEGIIDEIIDGIAEEIISNGATNDPAENPSVPEIQQVDNGASIQASEEPVIEGENPVIDKATSIEETPTTEETTIVEQPTSEGTVIEEQPATEEQPVAVPDNTSQNEAAESSNTGAGNEGITNDGTTSSVNNGSSVLMGDSGNNLGE